MAQTFVAVLPELLIQGGVGLLAVAFVGLLRSPEAPLPLSSRRRP